MLHRPRKFTQTVAIFSGLFFFSSIAPALALDPTGDWRVADGVANIRVAQCSGSMWGVVVWEKEPGGRDTNNPDAAKRNRPTLDMPVLLDMKKKKPGLDQWEGHVYNSKNGQTYDSTITPVDPNHLEIRGCVLGFLCGGETWTRIAPPTASGPANSMAKGAHRNTGTAPKTTSVRGEAVGDICLLPDIARFTH